MKKNLKRAVFILFLFAINNAFCQTSKYIRRASAAVYKGHYDEARKYYLKALEKDPDNFKANWGAGIVMAEYLASYENSLPYLEKALKLQPIAYPKMSKTDSLSSALEMLFSLGKVYAYFRQYENAMNCFEKVTMYANEDDEYFKRDLRKRMSDCIYARAHSEAAPSKKLYVVNAGNTINTEMDEYVPVLTTKNQIIFTSKRKDGIKEKINPDNGKYYEAMYIADIINGRTSNVKLFSNISGKSINANEAIVSIFPDGQKIFLYKDKKLYEGTFDRTAKKSNKTSDVINFDDYQNHACLTKDGNTVYFTSESESGNGGNDIYVSVKEADGSWGVPKNLGKTVNTSRDEEAPFISEDGKTLYFSSNGHPECYGEFDIYKTTFENGEWTAAVNMGLPINSSGNDVFYAVKDDGSYAYFSSTRPGGIGDLDIYKVNYTDKITVTDCGANVLALEAKPNKEDSFKYAINMGVPTTMKDKVISFSFSINDSLVSEKAGDMNYHFKKIGDYKLKAKLVAWCDTCINIYVACVEKILSIADTTPVIVASNNNNNNNNNSNTNNNNNNNSNNNNNNNNSNTNNNNNNSNNNNNNNNNNSNNNNGNVITEPDLVGQLTAEELNKIGLELKPLYFSFDDESLREDAKINLDYNIEILKKYPQQKIVVNGHTDSRGGPKRNLYLSDRRATTVRKYMISAGIAKRRISQSAKGEAFLINECDDNVPCDNPKHQLNRRVELKVVKK